MADTMALLEAIRASPDDDAPRLVYADWLEEHGDQPRAEFIRVQCALARLPQDDPTQRKPDITIARTRLGWEPKVPLRDGLIRTIESMRRLNFEDYRPPTPNY